MAAQLMMVAMASPLAGCLPVMEALGAWSMRVQQLEAGLKPDVMQPFRCPRVSDVHSPCAGG